MFQLAGCTKDGKRYVPDSKCIKGLTYYLGALNCPGDNKDLVTECEVCTGMHCLRFFVQTERPKAILSRTDRTNEGFIIWLCYTAVVDFTVEKTGKHFRC